MPHKQKTSCLFNTATIKSSTTSKNKLFNRLHKQFYSLLVLPVLIVAVGSPEKAHGQDSVRVTQTQADTTLEGIRFFFPKQKSIVSRLWDTPTSRLYTLLESQKRTVVEWDPASGFRIKQTLYGLEPYVPMLATFDEYAQLVKEAQKIENRLLLIDENKVAEAAGRGLLDFSIRVPGGDRSAFTTIFGKPEVNLRVNGTANMNVGASIQNVEDPSRPPDQWRQIDPTFNQNLQLNIQGTIGDKLTISTDWDTERQFDFQNRLSIVYEGYEDEIIKRIEMGNVSMETGNSLVRGGGALFGIKSVSELGPVRLTSVISQQKGESNTQVISGGSQELFFELRPADYEDDQHFFLDFYNRQVFEENMADPNLPTSAYNLKKVNVWIEDTQGNTDSDAIRALAMVDLGVVDNGDGTYGLPSNANDAIDDNLLEQLRSQSSINPDQLNLPTGVYQNSYYRPLPPEDYEIDEALGIISLKRKVGNQSSLAVSFTYEVNGQEVEVGDLNPNAGGYSFFKLLRPRDTNPSRPDWLLTLRNIYSLNVTNIDQEGFEFNLEITRDNIAQTNIQGRTSTLLQDLGLDRLNSSGAQTPDNQIDFQGTAKVFDPETGKIMFPYLEPFGARIDSLIQDVPTDQSGLVFDELYRDKVVQAQQSNKNYFYRISGSSKGGITSTFFLGELVEGSVKVYANGAELIEGTDYEVDYSFGQLVILNDRYLAKGQDLRIEYENNQFISIGQKNFMGLRAEYNLSEDIQLGGTFFRLNEQPLSDKIRIGNEPIHNTVLGLDAKASFDTPWLTRAIDKVPLLQTKEPSNISFSGEFAQLRPGVSQTNAVRDAIANNELFNDEENGLVFIDDFEGSEYTIPFDIPSRWNLAAAPAAVPGYAPDQSYFSDPDAFIPSSATPDKIARSDLRSTFAWYEIPRNISSFLGDVEETPESRTVFLRDVFQGRETNNPQEEVITTFDVYYDPTQRGPYNYNMDLKNLLENTPERTWGGMTAAVPSGQEDLVQNNIEFLEFWVQSILPDGQNPTGLEQDYDGKIYIDLGIISEDVIPNDNLNSEDGLARDPEGLEIDAIGRSFVPSIPSSPQGQFSNENRRLEDVGLDGVPNIEGFTATQTERILFSDFVDAMRDAYGVESEEYQKIVKDPSNDDYVFYGEEQVSDLKLHERFHRVRGYYEGNTPIAGGDKRAVTLKPDNEGLKSASSVQTNNAYFQYEINYNPADPSNLEIGSPGTFIVDKVDGGVQERTWRLIRVPLSEYTRKVGDIDSFRNISHIRIWMSGYKKPFTLRFATLEFLGSQWRKVQSITESLGSAAEFRISTVNIEENASRRPIPYRQPEGSIRAINRGGQIQSLENEQSLVLQVENLGSKEIQMVKKVFPNGLNFLNYSNIRMFVHAEGFDERGEAELVVRMGSDLENDFYEYRQPITPSDPNYNYGDYNPNERGRLIEEAEQVWLYDENSMNIVISAFNVLKQHRNEEGADPTVLYEASGLLGNEGVEGAVLAMKGNPSLDRISEFAVGIRNPYVQGSSGVGGPSLDAEIWLNELRVSGFDNENGWAANAKASMKLADFATVNANITRQTNGFGSIDSRLGERNVSDDVGYSVSSTVNLHKLIPDRFGWNFPVTVSTRRSTSTPKFLPDQGDIRLEDYINAIKMDEELNELQKDYRIDKKIYDIQSISENYSLNISNISKSNSKSPLAQYTIDKTKLSYVYNEGYARNPQLQFQRSWNYNAGISYNLNFSNVPLFRPFRFMEDIPGLQVLSGVRIGYMPSSVNASASLTRNYDERRRTILGSDATQPLLQSTAFTQKSAFGFNYNFTPSIITTFRSSTSFDLTEAGIKERGETGVDSLSYDLIPTFDVLEGLIADSLKGRRSNYTESYTASWRPRLNEIKGLEWLSYSASYGGGFQWNNNAPGSNLGARLSNSFQLDNSFKIDTESLFEKVGFIEQMREQDALEGRLRNQQNTDSSYTSPDLLENLQFVGRKILLSLFSMRSMDLSYSKNKSSSQNGYNGDAPLYYAFRDEGEGHYSPQLGYRLGIFESIPRSHLIENVDGNRAVLLPLNNAYSDNLTLGTQLTLFKNISIDLDWNTRWDERKTETLTLEPGNNINAINTASGDISSSVWTFGRGYERLFKTQLATAFADLDGNIISDASGNNDGRTVLNRVTLQEDFRASYLGGGNTAIGKKNFTPFPKPGWRVTWQGVERLIPFIGQFMSRASIVHSYTGNYRLGWQLNNSLSTGTSQTLGAITILDERDRYEPTSISIDQRFNPLIQLNVTWRSNLRTNIGYESSRITSLTMSSKTVSERNSRGFKFDINYTFRNVRIPLFPAITNNIDLAINGTFSEDTDQNFILPNDLNKAFKEFSEKGENLDRYTFDPQSKTGQTRFNGSLLVGYRISTNINSNFEYTYSRVIPNGSSIPPRTNQEIRFNIRIAIRSR